jgi:uncharacterized membrane protein YfcA
VIEQPLFYAAAVADVLITGISKSGFGGGLGSLGVPLMALFVSPLQAAAILLPILCLMDLINLWIYRESWDRTNIKILLPAGLVGVLIGAATFRFLSDAHIRIIIGSIALVFAANSFHKRDNLENRGPDTARGTFWGIVAGFVSFGVHAGAPPVNVYLLPQRLNKSVFVGTIAVLFATINYVKLIPYAFLGQLSANNLITAVILMPLVPLGVWLGLKLHKIIDEKRFYLVCYVFLAAMGTKLLYDGFAGL